MLLSVTSFPIIKTISLPGYVVGTSSSIYLIRTHLPLKTGSLPFLNSSILVNSTTSLPSSEIVFDSLCSPFLQSVTNSADRAYVISPYFHISYSSELPLNVYQVLKRQRTEPLLWRHSQFSFNNK